MFKKLFLLCVIILPLMAIENPELYIEQIQEQTHLDQRTVKNAISEWKRHHRPQNRPFPINPQIIKSWATTWQNYVATRQINRANKHRKYTITRQVTPRQRDRAYDFWDQHSELPEPTNDKLIREYSKKQIRTVYIENKKEQQNLMPDIFIPQPDTPPTPIPSPRPLPFLLSHTSPYLEPNNPSSSPPSVPPLELPQPLGEIW